MGPSLKETDIFAPKIPLDGFAPSPKLFRIVSSTLIPSAGMAQGNNPNFPIFFSKRVSSESSLLSQKPVLFLLPCLLCSGGAAVAPRGTAHAGGGGLELPQ